MHTRFSLVKTLAPFACHKGGSHAARHKHGDDPSTPTTFSRASGPSSEKELMWIGRLRAARDRPSEPIWWGGRGLGSEAKVASDKGSICWYSGMCTRTYIR